MALYLVSYDISENDAFEYENLWAKLREMKALKILYSEWVLVGVVGAASTIYDKLAPLTQGKDRLLVQEILGDAVWDKLLLTDEKFRELLKSARS